MHTFIFHKQFASTSIRPRTRLLFLGFSPAMAKPTRGAVIEALEEAALPWEQPEATKQEDATVNYR